MAKVISDEILKLKMEINSDEAQKRITDLEAKNKDLYNSLKTLNEQRKESAAQLKKEEKAINSYANEIDKLKLKIGQNQQAGLAEIQQIIKKQKAYDVSSKEYQALQAKRESIQAKVIASNNKLEYSIQQIESKQKKLHVTYTANANDLALLKNKISDFSNEIEINDKKILQEVKAMDHLKLTSTQLVQKINDLNATMSHLDPNSSAYKEMDANLKKLKDRHQELKTGTSASAYSIQKLSDKFNQYSGIATAAIATLAGVAFSIQGVIDANNKLVDAQTAVSKTTGLSTEEVKELTRAYSEFDTRTKRIDLLKISEIGGRLGVPKEEIKDFTREVDKAYVALGDSFSGGVEAVANKLGKIKGLFKETRDLSVADAINQVGSALNELGAAGAASEENISDFALRVGQLPESLKPTIAETLALGGAFEESGITAERASSGYSKFVRVAATQTAEFAKVMGITQKEVKDLINQDPLQFFLKFAEGAKGLDATKLSEVLDGLKLNDAEVISVVSTASENTDRFRKSIEQSNQALTEATSLQEEFNNVNNNSAAIYEKVQKKFSAMFTSAAVAKALNWLIETIGKLLGVVDDATGRVTFLKDTFIFFSKIVVIAVATMVSYNSVISISNGLFTTIKDRILAYTVVQKVNSGLTKISTGLQNLWNLTIGYGQLAIGKLTRSTVMQTAAQERLNLVTKLNPWGALLAVIAAVTVAYFAFRQENQKIIDQKKILNDVIAEGVKNAAAEVSSLDQLYKTATDVTKSQEDRLAAVKKLQEQYPSYFADVDAEIIMNGKAKTSYLELRDAIVASARASAAKAELESRAAERLKRDEKIQQEIEALQNKRKNAKSETTIGTGFSGANEFSGGGARTKSANEIKAGIDYNIGVLNNYQKKLKETDDAEDKFLLDEIGKSDKKASKLNQDRNPDFNTSTYQALGGKDKKEGAGKSKKEEVPQWIKDRDKILEGEKSYQQKLAELIANGDRNRIEMMEDGFEKEKALIIQNQIEKEADLENKKVSAADFANIDNIIAKEQNAGLKKRLQEIRFTWTKENEEYTKLQLEETEIAKLKIAALEDKYQNIAFQKMAKDFEKKQDLLEREMNQELAKDSTGQKAFLADQGYTPETLAGIRSWEESRAMIEKFFQEKRLREQIQFLQTMVAQMSVLQTQGIIDLTPEQLEQIDVMKDKIASLVAELAKLKNGGGTDSNLGSKLSGFGGQTDILGLTPDQWEAMFTNTDKLAENIQKVGAALQVAKNMMGMYSQFAQANEERLLQQYETASQRKTTLLDKQLKAGLITQEQYKKQTIANEKQLEKQKALLAYKSAKRQRAMQIAETVANTAMSIMGIWAQFPKFDFGVTAAIMSGVVGALGAVQVATIMSQPLPEVPGAEDGFYPVIRKQDNKLFQARKRRTSTGFYDEPTMLVGEQGAAFPELVVTQKTARQIDPDISNAYMREIARIEGYQDGYYKNVKTSQSSSTSSGDEIMIKLISTIDSFNETMQEIKTNGLETYIKDSLDNGAKIDKMVKGSQDLYNKNKHG